MGRIEEEATATPMEIVHMSEATAAHRDLAIKNKATFVNMMGGSILRCYWIIP